MIRAGSLSDLFGFGVNQCAGRDVDTRETRDGRRVRYEFGRKRVWFLSFRPASDGRVARCSPRSLLGMPAGAHRRTVLLTIEGNPMTTDQPDTVTDPAAPRPRFSTARRRSLLAAVIGTIAGTAALFVPATTSVAVASYSPPASTPTTLAPCPNPNPWIYQKTDYYPATGHWVSHYERCNVETHITEKGCYDHGWAASNSSKPTPPADTSKVVSC
jgi:hypothetical protein